MFDIYINKQKKQGKFDILAGGSNYAKVVLNVTANGYLNLTLVKVPNGSEFGPICNAYEILQMRALVQGTNEEDGNGLMLLLLCAILNMSFILLFWLALSSVNVIVKVRDELKMDNEKMEMWEIWSGDPCLPIPWEGLTCNSINGSSVITEL